MKNDLYQVIRLKDDLDRDLLSKLGVKIGDTLYVGEVANANLDKKCWIEVLYKDGSNLNIHVNSPLQKDTMVKNIR